MKCKRKVVIALCLICCTIITIISICIVINKKSNYKFTNSESSIMELYDYNQINYIVEHPIVYIISDNDQESKMPRETIEINSTKDLKKGDVVIYDLIITFTDATYSLMPNTQILWEISTIDNE